MSQPVLPTASSPTLERESLILTILDLENDRAGQLEDPALAYELSHYLKPAIDTLADLKRGSAEALAERDAEAELREIGRVEQSESPLGADSDASQEDEQSEDKKAGARRANKKKSPRSPLPNLLSLPPHEQARWIFMDRFIPLEKHEEILGFTFGTEDFAAYQKNLERLIEKLLLLPHTAPKATSNDIPGLQKIFASTLLIFRNSSIADDFQNTMPCSVQTLYDRFPSYFFMRRKKPNWFENRHFYTMPMGEPQWVLCGSEFLNCTLRAPERKLLGFARSWSLPIEVVLQKSILEDIYDRIVCGEALGENLFAGNCNSCSSTTYKIKGNKGVLKMVYLVQRARKIALYGKPGTPHWKAGRRLWPGVFPSLSLR